MDSELLRAITDREERRVYCEDPSEVPGVVGLRCADPGGGGFS